jgi:proteasome lid subunit RPN8/RPN11
MKKKTYRLLESSLNQKVKEAYVTAKKTGNEICGFLIDNGHFLEMISVKNKTKRGGGFSFYASQVRQLQRAVKLLGNIIVGTFHSHPYYFAKPGEGDVYGAPDDSLMLIIDAQKKNYALWYVRNLKAKKVKVVLIK